ncbi:hypothetical protein C8Q75DRAFT_889088 [Abortiporus biennis]|nr:hypothetical protein C8Q75DRAFT_889088 [Abortiporus biennis]
MANNPRNQQRNNPSGGTAVSESAGARLGEKAKGAFEVVQGMGDSIRGSAMDFVDSAANTGSARSDATTKGASKTEQGIQRMDGSHTSSGPGAERHGSDTPGSGVVTVHDIHSGRQTGYYEEPGHVTPSPRERRASVTRGSHQEGYKELF